MLTVAGVANMNLVELAVHAVRIELALRYAARNAAVDIVTHTVFLLAFIIPVSQKNIPRVLTNRRTSDTMNKRSCL